MSLTSVAPLLPVVLAAAALGRSLVESIGEAGRKRGARELAVVVALGCIALFLLALGTATVRDRACVAACAGVLWIGGRARRDARLSLLVVCAVALLLGAEPRYGIAFLPALAMISARALEAGDKKLAQRMALLSVVALVLGWAVAGRGASHVALPTWSSIQCWLDGALHGVGPIALAFAAGGVGLALTGASDRRGHAFIALIALVADSSSGRFSAVAALFVALSVGLGLLEVGAHLGRSPLPGVRLALGPLLALMLVEPLGIRVENARIVWPSLGAVPPPATHARVLRRAP